MPVQLNALRLRAVVESAGGSVLDKRPDFWRVKAPDGVTVAEICHQRTVVRLNYKGPDVNPSLASLALGEGLVYDTPAGLRNDWPGGGFVVTDETLAAHEFVLAEVVAERRVPATRPRGGYVLNDKQKRFARKQARLNARVADVKRVLAAELVAAGEWQPSDAENGAELNEALYRALLKVMRAEQSNPTPLGDVVTAFSNSMPFPESIAVTRERPAATNSDEGFEYWSPERRVIAERREAELVGRFVEYLNHQGRKTIQRQVATGSTHIEWDIYDSSHRILFEAKSDPRDRFQLRMAIGQLYDYSYFGFSPAERVGLRLSVLLPGLPPLDFAELLAAQGIGLAWEHESGFHEVFPAP